MEGADGEKEILPRNTREPSPLASFASEATIPARIRTLIFEDKEENDATPAGDYLAGVFFPQDCKGGIELPEPTESIASRIWDATSLMPAGE